MSAPKAIRTRIERYDAGWLATCLTCGWESYKQRRPSIDRVLADHKKTHQPKEGESESWT